MLRNALGLGVIVVVVGLLHADPKDTKDTEKKKDAPGVKATLVKADIDKKLLVVTLDGKKTEFLVDKDTKFIGPKGGVSKEGLKDDRLTTGAELRVVADKGKLKEVHLPYRSKKTKETVTKETLKTTSKK
jgi:hypothetical protein